MSHAAALRVWPLVVFIALTFFQGKLGAASIYWVYLAKTILGAAALFWLWRKVPEMRWEWSFVAIVAGAVVAVLWVGLDPFYPKWLASAKEAWHPWTVFGFRSSSAFNIIRLLGSSIVVPPLEEIFYRSFVYRYLIAADFESVSLRRFDLRAFCITSLIFGAGGHHEWLAGILCGMIYQAVVLRRGRLGEAIVAHSITNFLLGVWILHKHAWNFW